MVTVALLGTDRRDPPDPPRGGLGDLAADDPQPTSSQRLLQQVAATTVVRRAGLVPAAPATALVPPEPDARPITPAAATATWRRIVAEWPVLEDEWMLAVVQVGRRLAPELIAPVLARHRADAIRHARALAAAGPLGAWMIDWSPRLACTAKRAPARSAAAAAVGELPPLAIVPELAALLTAPASEVAARLAAGLASGEFGNAHRAVLINMVARVRRDALARIVAATQHVDAGSSALGLAFALGDLAQLRHDMLTELESP